MYKILFVLTIFLLINIPAFAQISDSNYRIYDNAGNSVNVSQIIDAAGKADAIFFGEITTMQSDIFCKLNFSGKY